MMERASLHCQKYDRDLLLADKEGDLIVMSIFSDYLRTISSVKLSKEQVKYLIELLSKEIEE